MLFSYSRLKKFEDCPWAWYQKYILEQEEPPTEAQVTGKVVHKALELYVKGVAPDKALLQAIIQEAVLAIDFKEAKRQFDKGVQYLKGLINGGADPAIWQAEIHFQLPLDPGDSFSPEIQGYIDFLDEYQMTDWKTGFKVYNPTDNHQLALYAWAVAQRSSQEVSANLYFLRTGTPKNHYYDSIQMENARNWALDLANNIEQKLLDLELGEKPEELFPVNAGASCKYCGFAKGCMSVEKQETQSETASKTRHLAVLIPGVPQTYEQAASLAAEIMQLEATFKAKKEDLKKWVKEQGPVVVDDQKWDFWPSIRWEFTPDQRKNIAKAIADSGQNPWKFIDFGSTQIKKLQKELSWTRTFPANGRDMQVLKIV